MADITDPSDFLPPALPQAIPNTLSQPLSSVDALLRCRVCKDLFNTPMMTSCSHTFCSLCIRRCLSADGRCPVCRSEDQELRLRRNWAVEEIIEGWRPGRQGVLDGLQYLAHSSPSQSELNDDRLVKRRKTYHDAEKLSEISPGRSTRSRTRKALENSQEDPVQELKQAAEVVDDTDDEGSQYGEEITQPVRKEPTPDDGLVPCPVCNKRMKEEAVFLHLDRCAGPSETAPSMPPALSEPSKARNDFPILNTGRKSSLPTSQERLPTINYSLLNDKALRKKLKDLGIPDWGPKLLLQRRHIEWLNLWNANCDSRHPRSKRELLSELDTWERTQGPNAPANGGSNAMFATVAGTSSSLPANNVGEKDFDKEGWSKSHDNDFKELIRQARAKRGAAAAPPTPQNNEQSKPAGIVPSNNSINTVSASSRLSMQDGMSNLQTVQFLSSSSRDAGTHSLQSNQSHGETQSHQPDQPYPPTSQQDGSTKTGRVFV